jgi:predicted GNAT family acetyltransferase
MSSSTTDSITVVHRPEAQCFEAIIEGQRCVADYRRNGDIILMTHTVVPPALEGRGIAAALVREALTWAQAEGFKVDPVCSYVRVYMKRHPEWRELQA